jgi:P-type Ca2+ transporter type 2C
MTHNPERRERMNRNHYHSLSVDEVLERLEVAPERGLSKAEAARRLKRHGPNRLEEGRRVGAGRILIEQFKSMVIIVLVIAGAVALSFRHWAETAAIGAVLLVNAALGFVTEWKALRSMEALREMGADTIRVRRDEEETEMDAEALVPGDIVVVEAGDVIPADVRLVEAHNLRVDESALTGESVPVGKRTDPAAAAAALAERQSMLYKGTTVTAGSGEGIVVHTGMQTELGRISELAEHAEKQATPLQKRLDQLGRRLAWITLAIAAVIAGVGLLAGQDPRRMIETAIALGVAAIPEGLPIVATIALARGMHRMARRHALIEKLPAVETLGATHVIFTDKTGTLTRNRMTLGRVVTPGGDFTLEDAGGEGARDRRDDPPTLRRVIEVGVLCNNASLTDADNDRIPEAEQGDPTETALLRAGLAVGLSREDLLADRPEVREVPFDAERMMMATFHRGPEGVEEAVKGAPEAVLAACGDIVGETPDDTRPLDEETRRRWHEGAETLAAEGLRLLALADRIVDDPEVEPYEGLRFLGLGGLADPPAEGVREALRECREAGIRVIMVTGDNPATAAAIARETGLTGEDETRVLQGEDLADPDEMDADQQGLAAETRIFARVSPARKLHLIKLFQQRGETVAMTGDGVNDAPALKKADIGVAMGRRGTDVARQAADMVLQDDAFASIVAAIRQGRVIFGNIRQSLMFMLCTNIAEVIAVAAAAAAGGVSRLPIPLLPLQILYLNVITDVFPALALGMGKGDPDVMRRPPRPRDESILTRGHWRAIGGWATLLAACVLASLSIAFYGFGFDERRAVTVSFLTLAFAKLWFVYNLRHPGSGLLRNAVVRNPWVAGAVVLCVLLLLAAVYLPGLSDLLKTVPPTGRGWGLLLALSLVPFVVGQIRRAFQKNKGPH